MKKKQQFYEAKIKSRNLSLQNNRSSYVFDHLDVQVV